MLQKENNLSRIDMFGTDELALATIFSFLDLNDIIKCCRGVCTKWKSAASKTFISPTYTKEYFKLVVEPKINTARDCDRLIWLAHTFPNLQGIQLGVDHKKRDFIWREGIGGEDIEADTRYYNKPMQTYPTYDVSLISTFRNLRVLELKTDGLMRGRYPCLFDFPMLETFKIEQVYSKVQWDFSMLAGFPQLKELDVSIDDQIEDDISNLRILKNTLQKVKLRFCDKVSGNYMVFADFPRLTTLDLDNEMPKLCGDIRDIKSTDFPSIEDIILPYNCTFGASKIERIADAKDCMLAVYNLHKQIPSFPNKRFKLAHDSQDRYDFQGNNSFHKPPFYIDFVKAGPRKGWRWTNCCVGGDCEMNWFDPEPEEGSSKHEEYMSVLKFRYSNDVDFFKGFHGPPTEEEYGELVREKSSLYSQCTGQRL